MKVIVKNYWSMYAWDGPVIMEAELEGDVIHFSEYWSTLYGCYYKDVKFQVREATTQEQKWTDAYQLYCPEEYQNTDQDKPFRIVICATTKWMQATPNR